MTNKKSSKKNDGEDQPEDRISSELSDVQTWSTGDVKKWLDSVGLHEYAHLIAVDHNVDGEALLRLTEDDLRSPPLSIPRLGDIKKLALELRSLRSAAGIEEQIEAEQFFKEMSEGIETIEPNGLLESLESPDTPKKDLIKLGLAFLYCNFAFFITTFTMVVVHDRVPDIKRYPPLPDLFLDNIPYIPWAFELCEIIGMVLTVIWVFIIFLHKHKVVLLRRMLVLLGSVFLLRCVTMIITSLSVPGSHLECVPKKHEGLYDRFVEAFHIWSHLGMSIQGVRTCGDYMFSGHTTTLTMLNHFITECIFFILAGHEHYSIDVFIAFYISSRLFLYYHTYAYNHSNLISVDPKIRFWFPIGWFFEAGGIGRVGNEYAVPWFYAKTEVCVESTIQGSNSSDKLTRTTKTSNTSVVKAGKGASKKEI